MELRAMLRLLLIAVLVALLPGLAVAQGSFEIQVYGSETVAPGTTMVELHSNSAIQGTTRVEDGVLPTQNAVHETIEITHGWTAWFETGFYIFTSVQTMGPEQGYWWVGDHIRPRVRAPEEWHLPVGLSLSTEIGYQRSSFSEDTWSWEIRPIIDKRWGRWYFAVNPNFEKSIHGLNSSAGFDFAPSSKVSFDLTKWVAVGVEYYSSLGPVGHWKALEDQQHQIFPTIDLNFSPAWEFDFGVG